MSWCRKHTQNRHIIWCVHWIGLLLRTKRLTCGTQPGVTDNQYYRDYYRDEGLDKLHSWWLGCRQKCHKICRGLQTWLSAFPNLTEEGHTGGLLRDIHVTYYYSQKCDRIMRATSWTMWCWQIRGLLMRSTLYFLPMGTTCDLLMRGTNSEVSGRFSATASMKTEKASSTVMPRAIFSPLSGGRQNTSSVSADIMTQGKTTLYM